MWKRCRSVQMRLKDALWFLRVLFGSRARSDLLGSFSSSCFVNRDGRASCQRQAFTLAKLCPKVLSSPAVGKRCDNYKKGNSREQMELPSRGFSTAIKGYPESA